LAHPFRYNGHIGLDIEQFPPDAIEAYSNNISQYTEKRILDVANRLGVNVLSNSDAHHTTKLGRYYNVLERAPKDERELIEMLKSGQFTYVSP
jgi:histidinol phosphatase-like PHP family hydrolase